MVIDIISYTEEQLSYLSAEQIMEVKTAQLKKNALLAKQEKICKEEAYRLQRNGMYRSGLYKIFCKSVETEYTKKIEEIRDALLFYLQYTSRPNDEEGQDAPYVVNYALSLEERLNIVRDYYNGAYTAPIERFKAFKADEVAIVYLGEYYAPLYHVYLQEAEDAGYVEAT